jgi:hypothetical protein
MRNYEISGWVERLGLEVMLILKSTPRGQKRRTQEIEEMVDEVGVVVAVDEEEEGVEAGEEVEEGEEEAEIEMGKGEGRRVVAIMVGCHLWLLLSKEVIGCLDRIDNIHLEILSISGSWMARYCLRRYACFYRYR